MISDKGKKLVKDLMLTTGGDPVEWTDNYNNLINYIEELETRLSDAGWQYSVHHSQLTGGTQ